MGVTSTDVADPQTQSLKLRGALGDCRRLDTLRVAEMLADLGMPIQGPIRRQAIWKSKVLQSPTWGGPGPSPGDETYNLELLTNR
jgi:hypothetical protein